MQRPIRRRCAIFVVPIDRLFLLFLHVRAPSQMHGSIGADKPLPSEELPCGGVSRRDLEPDG
ncbi:MAG: hypothetical protein JW940_11400, partial [Polyangiaceae bacterium]|nr:hypothetical protein [Polyangiaceae bacterium]